MTTQAFTDWLAGIVANDDPARGGAGILTLGDCRKCEGFGIVEHVGAWHSPQAPRLTHCPGCDGTGNAPEPELCPCAFCTCGDPAAGKGLA
jgi:hypothetical protein